MTKSIWSKLGELLSPTPEQREAWERAERTKQAIEEMKEAVPFSDRYLVRYVSGFPVGKSGQEVKLGVTDEALLVWWDKGMLDSWGQEVPLGSLHAARIETGERLTAMRIITTGPIGFFWKKKDKFLVLEWDEPSGLNVPLIFSFNAANKVLAEIQEAKATLKLADN